MSRPVFVRCHRRQGSAYGGIAAIWSGKDTNCRKPRTARSWPVTPKTGDGKNDDLNSWLTNRRFLMKRLTRRTVLAAAPAVLAFGSPLLASRSARAAKQYGPGATDSEIKIGNTGPYSGPLSNASPIPISMAAYFKMINDQGGVNGRKISFTSYDDGYTPPKTVEMTRKLVESDQVLFCSGAVGTPTNSAIWHYMNEKKVPQLFLSTGATKWDDPKGHPWTMGFFVSYQAEGRIYAAYILKEKPDAKIGVLYQNDDFGKDYLKGLVDGLGDKASSMIKVKDAYETTDATVDSQMVEMKSAGCDVLVTIAIPKFGAQAIRKVAEIGWKPLHILNGIASSVGATLKPAGLENGKGIISDNSFKDPTDPQWKDDAGYKQWLTFMDKYYPSGDKSDQQTVYGHSIAATTVQVLKQCGDDLTRENVMKQAANLHNFELPMLLPGIAINTSATNFAPIRQAQMRRFDGERYVPFGPVLNGAIG
ncbi:MAG TPA: ABC transporter substrate-binding protein [Stellaceae bacterium]|nr:ABC transporter substrate-binding protein [Stellaceae bacterium]